MCLSTPREPALELLQGSVRYAPKMEIDVLASDDHRFVIVGTTAPESVVLHLPSGETKKLLSPDAPGYLGTPAGLPFASPDGSAVGFQRNDLVFGQIAIEQEGRNQTLTGRRPDTQ